MDSLNISKLHNWKPLSLPSSQTIFSSSYKTLYFFPFSSPPFSSLFLLPKAVWNLLVLDLAIQLLFHLHCIKSREDQITIKNKHLLLVASTVNLKGIFIRNNMLLICLANWKTLLLDPSRTYLRKSEINYLRWIKSEFSFQVYFNSSTLPLFIFGTRILKNFDSFRHFKIPGGSGQTKQKTFRKLRTNENNCEISQAP